MIFIVVNSAKHPASTKANPDALFVSREKAKTYINYLQQECGLVDESFDIIPYQEEIKDLESPWAFVEKYLPNYSRSEEVSESNDLEMIIDGDWINSECATEVRNDIIEEFIKNNGIEPEDFQVVEIAEAKLLEVNASLYELAIEGFIDIMKTNNTY